VGQAVFFLLVVWTIVSGSVPILRETLFAPHVPRNAEECRAELVTLRARLAEAALRQPAEGELAAVTAFRRTLGEDLGRAWDSRLLELIDGCPRPEANAAYALARLKAADEALLRLDTREGAPARKAHADALRAITPSSTQ
jgi:hypothetical protein